MRTCESVDELANELGVTRQCLYKWRTRLEAVEPGQAAARPSTHALAHRKEVLQLRFRKWRTTNIFLTEAILKLLAERGILTGEEVLERVKKLKNETPLQFRWMQ